MKHHIDSLKSLQETIAKFPVTKPTQHWTQQSDLAIVPMVDVYPTDIPAVYRFVWSDGVEFTCHINDFVTTVMADNRFVVDTL